MTRIACPLLKSQSSQSACQFDRRIDPLVAASENHEEDLSQRSALLWETIAFVRHYRVLLLECENEFAPDRFFPFLHLYSQRNLSQGC